jgi:hypothetical protein
VNKDIISFVAAHVREMRNAHRIFVRKPEGKRTHGGPRYRWEDNIKMGFKEMGYENVD